MTDETTIAVYNEKVGDYQKMVENLSAGVALDEFMAALPDKGYVMDLGCGPGNSAALMRNNGFLLDAVDASPAMVALANESFDLNARLSTFNEVKALETYDGIWANFSLLHATAEDFPSILKAIHRALKPNGAFHIGMKTGEGAQRDALGRFYTFYSTQNLTELLGDTGFTIQSVRTGIDPGLAGTNDPWVTLLSTKTNPSTG